MYVCMSVCLCGGFICQSVDIRREVIAGKKSQRTLTYTKTDWILISSDILMYRGCLFDS